MEDISEEENEATSQEDVLDYRQSELLKEQREHHLYQLKSLQGQLLDNLIAFVSDSNESVSPDIRQRILSSIKRESTTSSCDTQATQQTIPSSYPDSLVLSHSNVSRGDSVSGDNGTFRGTSSGTLVEKWATPVDSATSGCTLNSQAMIASLHSPPPSLPPTLAKESMNESESPLPENSSDNSSILTSPYLTPPKQAYNYNPIASPQRACRSSLSPISNASRRRSLIPKTLVPNPASMEVLVSENESLRIRNGQLNEELEQFNRCVVYLYMIIIIIIYFCCF